VHLPRQSPCSEHGLSSPPAALRPWPWPVRAPVRVPRRRCLSRPVRLPTQPRSSPPNHLAERQRGASQKAQEIARVLGDVAGATDVQLASPPGLPQLTIRLRKDDLERWGFGAVDVLELVRAAYQGDTVGQTYRGNQVFNVIAILDQESRNDVMKVGDLP